MKEWIVFFWVNIEIITPLKIEKVFLLKKLKIFSKQEGFKRVRVCTIT